MKDKDMDEEIKKKKMKRKRKKEKSREKKSRATVSFDLKPKLNENLMAKNSNGPYLFLPLTEAKVRACSTYIGTRVLESYGYRFGAGDTTSFFFLCSIYVYCL